MVYLNAQSARQNALLAALPLADFVSLGDGLEMVDLAPGQVIDEPALSPGSVYFPVSCSVSLVSSTQEGDMSELAITGPEGLVGIGAVLGMPVTNHRAVVLCAGQAYRMSVAGLDMALTRSQALRRLVLRYIQALIGQMAQSIVCSRHHSVLQRLSFWLLFNRDRSASEQLKVTHETIAHMLGVRRESITQAAGLLQMAGSIRTSRGRISIEDPQGLQRHACECYAMVQKDYARLQQPLRDVHSLVMTPDMDPVLERAAGGEAQPAAQPLDGERKYADMYDFAPVGLLSVDPQGRLLEINMAGAILLGIQRSRSTHHVFTEFLSEEAQEAFLDFHAEVMSGKCRRHCELALKPTAQRPALVVRIDATVDEDGLENRMVMSDITEQVQEAQALAAREREQRALLEHLPGVFWIKDEMGRFVAVNHLAQRQGSEATGEVFGPVTSGGGHMHFATNHVPGAPRSAGLDN